MSKMIQIREVPDALHRVLAVRAAQAGKSLSDYLLEELRRVAERPTVEDLRQRIALRVPVTPGESAASAVRAERDAREAQLAAALGKGGARRGAKKPRSPRRGRG
jgi:plasmid stability protein